MLGMDLGRSCFWLTVETFNSINALDRNSESALSAVTWIKTSKRRFFWSLLLHRKSTRKPWTWRSSQHRWQFEIVEGLSGITVDSVLVVILLSSLKGTLGKSLSADIIQATDCVVVSLHYLLITRNVEIDTPSRNFSFFRGTARGPLTSIMLW